MKVEPGSYTFCTARFVRSSGADVHRELELLVGGGISPADAIVIATRNAARFLAISDETGTIEVGKSADLVLLDADPLTDINNAKRIAMVVSNGSVRTPACRLNRPGGR